MARAGLAAQVDRDAGRASATSSSSGGCRYFESATEDPPPGAAASHRAACRGARRVARHGDDCRLTSHAQRVVRREE